MSYRQYKRTVVLRFGEFSDVSPAAYAPGAARGEIRYENGEGLRMVFDVRRTADMASDKATVRIYNMAEKTSKAIVSDVESYHRARVAAYKVNQDAENEVLGAALREIDDKYALEILVGYGSNITRVFRGNYLSVDGHRREGMVDRVTTIELGDTHFAVKDSWTGAPLGPGSTLFEFINSLAKDSGLRTAEDVQLNVSAVAGKRNVTLLKNGVAATSRSVEAVENIADTLGAQAFVRDGQLYFLPADSVLSDYSVALRQGVDLIDLTVGQGFKQISGRCLINPSVEPGRGLRLLDSAGKPQSDIAHIVINTRVYGDTHGNNFYVDFEASQTTGTIPPLTMELS